MPPGDGAGLTAQQMAAQLAFGRAAGLGVGAARADAQVTAMQDRTRDLSPVTKAIARTLNEQTQKAFFTGKSPKGEPFAPLAKSTIASRKRAQPGRRVKILDFTGDARRATKFIGAAGGVGFQTVQHIIYNARGNVRLPKRNPLPIEIKSDGSSYSMDEQSARIIAQRIADYIATGRVT